MIVLVVGLALTAVLAWVVAVVKDRNESRLLNLQVREAGTVISEVATTVQTPLASAAEIANATGGDPAKFADFAHAYVSSTPEFVSFSLWRLGGGPPQLLETVGKPPALATHPAAVGPFFQQAQKTSSFAVSQLIAAPGPDRIGYAYTAGGQDVFVAYAEAQLPPGRKAVVPKDSAFADLDFALFLGRHPSRSSLLEATRYPLPGATASTSSSFGDSALTLVGTAVTPLGGALANGLPWIIAAAGVVLSAVAAVLAYWLVRRRAVAEALAEENQRLYRQQRSIAETLQRSLLPEALPSIPGIDLAVRYVPGGPEVDVGGDWYDVIGTDQGFLFVVGDVSGRGLRAATKMAALHYAIRAYAAEGHPPDTIVEKLGRLVTLERDGHFATVLCGHVDVGRRQVSVVDAGHLAPLVVTGDTAYYPPLSVGVPVGVAGPRTSGRPYQTVTFEVPPGATLLAFTDGLVERRTEGLDAGLDRLRAVALRSEGSLDDLVGNVVDELVGNDVGDDTAVLGVRWQGQM